MKVSKKVSIQGQFARVILTPKDRAEGLTEKDLDIVDGNEITILTGGEPTVGKYGEQIVYKVNTRNGERNLSINQTSVNALIDAFGDETEGWVGKRVTANLIKALVSGTMRNVVYLVPTGWILNDQGKVVKDTGDSSSEKEGVVQLDEQEVDPKDIPF